MEPSESYREASRCTESPNCGLIMSMNPQDTNTVPSPNTLLVSLVRRARSGDRAAFGQLVEMHHERIFRMVFYRSKKRMDAEDLCQEVFVRAFKSLPKLREEDKFVPWLYSIAGNTVRDYYRKQKVLSIFQSEPDVQIEGKHDMEALPQPLDQVLRQEFWDQVEAFSHKLSKWEKEIFYLRFLDHLAIKDISQATGKSQSAVKTHLYRALGKYRKQSGAFARFVEDRHEK